MPATDPEIERIEPRFEYLPGWQTPTSAISRFEDLPQRARDYIKFLEQATCVEIGLVSVGPERNQTILAPHSRFEAALA